MLTWPLRSCLPSALFLPRGLYVPSNWLNWRWVIFYESLWDNTSLVFDPSLATSEQWHSHTAAPKGPSSISEACVSVNMKQFLKDRPTQDACLWSVEGNHHGVKMLSQHRGTLVGFEQCWPLIHCGAPFCSLAQTVKWHWEHWKTDSTVKVEAHKNFLSTDAKETI